LKNLRAPSSRSYFALFLIMASAGLASCADHMPVPGGSDDINKSCFTSVADMQARVLTMNPGEVEGQVFAELCAKRESMTRLERHDIRTALLGGPDVLFTTTPGGDTDSQIIQSLYGYNLVYKQVKSVHGFVNPIRIRTDQTGFNYTITLIFREGKLYVKPILTGGPVKDVSSGTLFDFITPGTLLSRAPMP
jgi:hypothetical protein